MKTLLGSAIRTTSGSRIDWPNRPSSPTEGQNEPVILYGKAVDRQLTPEEKAAWLQQVRELCAKAAEEGGGTFFG